MMSRFFITRPIFACVISAFIVIAGLAGMRALPVSAYPNIIPPQVTVSATYPGATAETIAETVAAPLEEQINGVEGMLYMNSISAGAGSLVINITFAVGTDPDKATINVNNRVRAAESRLPEEVRRQGVTVLKSFTTFLQIVSFYSPDNSLDELTVANHALLYVVDELRRVPGVGDVQMWGQKYSMRIWLQPDKLAQLGLTTADVAQAVREQNSQFASGRVGVDLRDVARIELGAQSYDFAASNSGRAAVMSAVVLQPGANALQVGDAVEARLKELSAEFPKGMTYAIPYDTNCFVELSIKEVVKTLFEAMAMVFVVVLVFLQNWRATLIPMLAVPVSLIGTFAAMYLLGFSINMLTLFGMVLAIGIVVDDAIVVLENVERIMRTEHLNAREATVKAMEQVTRPVIAIVLVLTAVFLPVAFMGGLVGEMYRQFAVTISISVIISGFVALTLTPSLCALLMRHDDSKHHPLAQKFNDWFSGMTGRYMGGVSFLMRRGAIAAGVFAAMLIATLGLYRSVPSSLAPTEDQGYVFVMVMLQDAASLDRTGKVVEQLVADMQKHPAVESSIGMTGMDPLTFAFRTNTGVVWVPLKPWDERKSDDLSPGAVVGAVFGASAKLRDAFVIAVEPPAIEGLSQIGGFESYIQSRGGGDVKALEAVTQKFLAAAAQQPELANVNTAFSASVPQIRIDLDREKALMLGVPIPDVFETLQSTMGAMYVNDFNKSGRVFQVQLQSEPRFRAHPEDIRDVYVRSRSGELVPLTALATVREVTGPELVERFNVFTSAKVFGNAAPGYSSGEALAAVEKLAAEVLPSGYTLAWTGASYQEKISSSDSSGIFVLGVLMVFLILAAQFERWTLPLAVILAVPFAAFGALLAVWARGLENNIYLQIGMLTLVGLAAKNAILIVEFAIMKQAEGMSFTDAALEGARLRFRPIIMTSLTLIFGVLPLAISTGAGAASRHALGTTVIGGMLGATFIATLFVPLFYRWVAGLGVRRAKPAQTGDAAGIHHA